uniref:Methyltransferase family protein n=1 Tax=Eubacterium cellulosolvens (strain ATCC 43171 / JCM 9499 / 6) TaxID=633697 RepID=I5AWZ7_EUBC6
MNDVKNYAAEPEVTAETVDRFKELLEKAVDDSIKGIDDSENWRLLSESPMDRMIPAEACGYIRDHLKYREALENGKMNAMFLLFPGGSTTVAEKIYGDTAINRYMNRTVAEIVYRKCREGKKRILEVGGGVGATTGPVMDRIKGMDFEYRFTDVSRFFLNHVQKKWPEVTTGVLDLDQVPTEEDRRKYDMIIAAGVLNAVRDIPRSIDTVLSMLEEDGILLMTEPTDSHPEIDVSQGFMMQKFTDRRKEKGRWFLTVEEWRSLFKRRGYDVCTLPGEDSPYHRLGYTVFLAYRTVGEQ